MCLLHPLVVQIPTLSVCLTQDFYRIVLCYNRYKFFAKFLTLLRFLAGVGSGGVGYIPEDGVPDMTVMSDINESGINKNLRVRYGKDNIYVSDILQWSTNPKNIEYYV